MRDAACWHVSRPREASGLSLCPIISPDFSTCTALERGDPRAPGGAHPACQAPQPARRNAYVVCGSAGRQQVCEL